MGKVKPPVKPPFDEPLVWLSAHVLWFFVFWAFLVLDCIGRVMDIPEFITFGKHV